MKEITLTDPKPATTPEFGGYTVVARALAAAYPNPGKGLKAFTRQQVHVWWCRRARNGFPGKYPVTLNGSRRELFRVSEVVDWWVGYIPSTGGRKAASESLVTSEKSAN
jgi:hypothetical protein